MTLSPEVTSKRSITLFSTLEERLTSMYDGKYTYDNSVYVSSRSKMVVTCPIHGDFKIVTNDHVRGKGCAKCNNKVDTEEFIRRANLRHNDYYSYEKAEYLTAKTLVIVTCPVHGDFEQKASTHLYGDGCKKCVQEKLIVPIGTRRTYIPDQHARINSTERFITIAKEVHKNTYKYDKTIFTNSNTKVTVTCPIHGDFEQLPRNHFYLHQGCPLCKGRGFDSTKKHAWFYVYYLEKGKIGYGITTQPYIRNSTHLETFKKHGLRNAKLVTMYKGQAKEVETFEKLVKQLFSSSKIAYDGFKRENTSFSKYRSLLQLLNVSVLQRDHKTLVKQLRFGK